MDKKAIIVIGLPGSGKSLFVRRLVADLPSNSYAIHSTDHYFYRNQVYSFDESLLSKNHRKNQCAFEQSLHAQIPLVICDNTNIQQWQRQPYIDLACAQGYRVELVRVGLLHDRTQLNKYVSRNSHGVGLDVMRKMLSS